MMRRAFAHAVLALVAFVLWTAVVHSGIAHGSRHSLWLVRDFGSWPATITHLDGSSNIELSVFAPFGSPPAIADPGGNLIGRADVGTEVDSADSHNMNGSRFVAPMQAGEIRSIAVHVAGPIDAAPYDRFQLAVYDDRGGAPHRLVAVSATGQLTADAWNWASIDAVLEPNTAYWLVYNSNGRSGDVNNATFRRAVGTPLDAALQSRSTGPVNAAASRITAAGSAIPVTAAIVVLAVVAVRRRRKVAAAALLIGYGVMQGVALALRRWIFAPYGLYPSGHALRLVFLAIAVAWIVRSRTLTIVATALAAVVSVVAVYERGHFSEEIIGGILLGWSMGMLVRVFERCRPPQLSPGSADRSTDEGPAQRPTVLA